MSEWRTFRGSGPSRPGAVFPKPPPWRDFARAEKREEERGATYQVPPEAVEAVNVAICLRRPLLVTGKPGTGKSSLAHRIAYELGLGKVLAWPISTRTTLRDGLYQYDAMSRLQDVSRGPVGDVRSIGSYVRLGPLGTALLPADRPRLLLVDEIDKGDVDLPNDLLHVFEEGNFAIPELQRELKAGERTSVWPYDVDDCVEITSTVRCTEFPIVILTSNGEREFPPAFKRRCIPLNLSPPDEKALDRILKAHFGSEEWEKVEPQLNKLVHDFLSRRNRVDLASDQLLNAVLLVARGADLADDRIRDAVFAALAEAEDS